MMDALYQAAHNFGFLSYGLDPTHGTEGFLDKGSVSYKRRLAEARDVFYPLARRLHEVISKRLNLPVQ